LSTTALAETPARPTKHKKKIKEGKPGDDQQDGQTASSHQRPELAASKDSKAIQEV